MTSRAPRKSRTPAAEKQMKSNPAASGASAAEKSSLFSSYISSHKKAARESFQQQVNRPVGSMLTWGVMGVALALPVALFVLLFNIQSLGNDWEGTPRITLYLKEGVPELDAGLLAQEVKKRGSVESVELITANDALSEFVSVTGLGDAVDYLGRNPLPHLVMVKPVPELKFVHQLEELKEALLKIPEVAEAQLDVLWVQRLFAITELLKLVIYILSFLLTGIVLLVLGNTIRLAIENRKDEIVLVKLVGGTDGFVRRPFLYSGLYFGLFGGIIAVILVQTALFLISGPIDDLARSYQSDFRLAQLGFSATLSVLFVGMALGWLGAFLSVNRHISEIEPT